MHQTYKIISLVEVIGLQDKCECLKKHLEKVKNEMQDDVAEHRLKIVKTGIKSEASRNHSRHKRCQFHAKNADRCKRSYVCMHNLNGNNSCFLQFSIVICITLHVLTCMIEINVLIQILKTCTQGMVNKNIFIFMHSK